MARDDTDADEALSLERARVKAALRKQLFEKIDDPIKIGRFVVTERLGAGGMGIVYGAFDPKLKREIAIKLVRIGAEDEEQRMRLEREAQAMARLSHPNVIPVYEVGEHAGQVFVAMELVRGETLRAWQSDRDAVEIVAMYCQAGKGLVAAHDAGLVHRDFKPENVLVGEDGRPRVMDFGLARPSSHGDCERRGIEPGEPDLDTPMTRTGTVLGTPAYMAPEQFQGRLADARSDQFSFCVALWEALEGRRPFAGDTFPALQQAVENGRLQPARVMPARIQAVLVRGLAAPSDARFGSLGELIGKLNAPSRRRGWVAGGLVAGSMAVAGAFALSSTSAEAQAPCLDASTALEEVWNDEARAAVTEAVSTIGKERAALTVEFVTEELDGYVDAWHEANAAVCRGLTEAPGDERVASQRRCLDDRKRVLGASIEVLTEPSVELLFSAPYLVIELPKIADCDDDRLLRAESRDRYFTSDPETHEAAQLAIARLGARIAGEFKDPKEGTAVVERARRTGSRALEAEALFLLGSIQHSTTNSYEAEPDKALETLEQAFVLAQETGHDRIAARAAASIAYVTSFYRGPGAAAPLLGRARPLVERTHDPEATFRTLMTRWRVALTDEGRAHEAELRAALVEHVETQLHPLHRFNLYLSIAEDDDAFGREEYARAGDARARRARQFEALHPPGSWSRCFYGLYVADAYYLAGRMQDVERWLGRCEPLPHLPANVQDSPGHTAVLRALLMLGPHFEDVAALLEPSLEVFEKHPATREPTWRWTYGALHNRGAFDEAFRLLELMDGSAPWVGPAKALTYLAKGDCPLAVSEAASPTVPKGDFDALRVEAICAARRGDRTRALERLELLEDQVARAPFEAPSALSTAMQVHLALNAPDTALELAEASPRFRNLQMGDVREIQGPWGLALLAKGDAEAALPKLELADSPHARLESDQRFRFGLARALLQTGGDRERAIRVAKEARARWIELGPQNDARVAEVDAWLERAEP